MRLLRDTILNSSRAPSQLTLRSLWQATLWQAVKEHAKVQTDKSTNGQTDKRTQKLGRSHNLLGGGNDM